MPLQLAFSSNAYLDVPVEEAVARIAAAGDRGIETYKFTDNAAVKPPVPITIASRAVRPTGIGTNHSAGTRQ